MSCQKTPQKIQMVKDARWYRKKPALYTEACLIAAVHANDRPADVLTLRKYFEELKNEELS